MVLARANLVAPGGGGQSSKDRDVGLLQLLHAERHHEHPIQEPARAIHHDAYVTYVRRVSHSGLPNMIGETDDRNETGIRV